MASGKTIIGWREWCALPELGIKRIKAKIDTGAKTSALHAFSVATFRKKHKDYVKFSIHPIQNNVDIVVKCEAKIADIRLISDSGGHIEERFVIKTPLLIGGKEIPIEISLTNRDTMAFRMLLGRTALRTGQFIIEPGASYLLGHPS